VKASTSFCNNRSRIVFYFYFLQIKSERKFVIKKSIVSFFNSDFADEKLKINPSILFERRLSWYYLRQLSSNKNRRYKITVRVILRVSYKNKSSLLNNITISTTGKCRGVAIITESKSSDWPKKQIREQRVCFDENVSFGSFQRGGNGSLPFPFDELMCGVLRECGIISFNLNQIQLV